MRKNDLSIIISAPSGAGKTTIINKVISGSDDYAFVISTTTRKKRKSEKEGRSYYFISSRSFREKIERDEFIEWSSVHQNYYGVEKKEFDRIMATGKIPLFDVDVQGAAKLKKKIPGAVFIFIIPPSIRILKERLINRDTDSKKDINIRIENAIKEIHESENYDYLIINDDITNAVDDFKGIIRAELCRKNISFIKNNSYFNL